MDLKTFMLALVGAILFCIAMARSAYLFTELFERTWEFKPRFIPNTRNWFVAFTIPVTFYVLAVFFCGRLANRDVQSKFRNRMVLLVCMAIAILLMLLQFVIMHYVVFAVFATDTLRGTWSRDDILNISRCIHFDIFFCLFPQDKFKNSTDVRVCTKRQQFIYYMPKLEQMFVLACIASCMLITSLIETTIYLFAEYEKSADTKIKYLPTIDKQLSPTALIVATVLCITGVTVFCIAFYRAASLLWKSIDQFSIIAVWLTGVQFLYCAICVFTAWLGLMILFAQYHMTLENTAWKRSFNTLLMVAAFLLLLGWIAIMASLGIPTSLGRLLECKCVDILNNENKITASTCLDLSTLGRTLTTRGEELLKSCGQDLLQFCRYRSKGVWLFVLISIVGHVVPIAMLLYLIAIPRGYWQTSSDDADSDDSQGNSRNPNASIFSKVKIKIRRNEKSSDDSSD